MGLSREIHDSLDTTGPRKEARRLFFFFFWPKYALPSPVRGFACSHLPRPFLPEKRGR